MEQIGFDLFEEGVFMYYLGIDLGGTNIAAGLVTPDGKLVRKDSVPTLRERPYQEIMRDMAQLSLKLIREAGITLHDVAGIGIGSPGTPDSKEGILIYANNLKFKNVPIRAEIQKYIDLPVYLDNDANCAALAESIAGAAKGVEDSVTITLGTGVGSGVVINHRIYSGFNYAAAELGHTVIVVDGEPCTCGRKGCWEAYASATGLIHRARQAAEQNPGSAILRLAQGDLDKIDAKIPFDAAKEGDPVGKQVIHEYLKYLAAGLVNVVNAFQPEVIVVGGGVSKQGEYLLEPLRKLIDDEVYSHDIPHAQLKEALMGNDAGIIGAALLCL